MMSKHVFISYSTDDAPSAAAIRDGLEAAGIPCWMAPRDIVPGADYAEQILGAIEACAVMVLVLSESSNHSQYVRNEVERAVAKRRTVIPLRIHNVQPARSLEFFVSNAQWIEAWQGSLDSHIATLVAAIRSQSAPVGAGGDDRRPTAGVTGPAARVLNNLPAQLTRFIGRERAIAEVTSLLGTARLVTLTGIGGAGKTRLALRVAAGATPNFEDGVWLVELAAVSAGSGVADAVANTFGLPSSSEQMLGVLAHYLRAKRMLLVLDNCEHLIQASAELAETLLQGCPNLHILATSREVLGVAGEVAWPVPSLQVPDVAAQLTPAELANFEAVRLFIDRAALASPGFVLTAANADAVRQICARLDGIPLAIELAAARVKTLTPQDISARLSDRFRLLTGGSRTVLPRHQTLRALIDWSYQLLTESERIALRRLAVFVGGWTLEAAEHVCSDDDTDATDVLDTLSRLVDKSLVVLDVRSEPRRYGFLETIRQYLVERLKDSGEGPASRDRHLRYFLAYSERFGSDLVPPEHAATVDIGSTALVSQLADLANMALAMDWASETGRTNDALRVILGLRNLVALRPERLDVMNRSRRLLENCSEPYDPRLYALACVAVANQCAFLHEVDLARAWLEKAEAANAVLDDPQVRLDMLLVKAEVALIRGEYPLVDALLAERRSLRERAGLRDDAFDAEAIWILSHSLLAAGDYAEARNQSRMVHAFAVRLGNPVLSTNAARTLGYTSLYLGEAAEAAQWLRESLLGNHALGDRQAVAACLAAWAAFAMMQGGLTQAAQLFGASQALQEVLDTPLQPWDATQAQRNAAILRVKLNGPELDAAWAAGRAMSAEQAIDLAIANDPLTPG